MEQNNAASCDNSDADDEKVNYTVHTNKNTPTHFVANLTRVYASGVEQTQSLSVGKSQNLLITLIFISLFTTGCQNIGYGLKSNFLVQV